MLTSAQVGSTMDGTSGASAEKYVPSPSSPQGTAKLVSSADMSSFMAMASPAMCAAGREAEAMNRVRLFQVSVSISPFSFLRYKKRRRVGKAAWAAEFVEGWVRRACGPVSEKDLSSNLFVCAVRISRPSSL